MNSSRFEWTHQPRTNQWFGRHLAQRTAGKAFLMALVLGFWATSALSEENNPITISVLGTNDLHGAMFQDRVGDGLATFSGFVNNLRQQRAEDGGAVILLDAGDTWQGTLESNFFEGATMVDAFNHLGYTAAAIGNHEFDFGPAGEAATPSSPTQDPRGALIARAIQANFPLLMSNLRKAETGAPVEWPGVVPSVMITRSGVRIGIVGGVTRSMLMTTHNANTWDLQVTPLASDIEREAQKLRERGAEIVLVTVHAGGRCTQFSDPYDISECDLDDEVFQLAEALPSGLVDVIVGGHVHEGIAHYVNDIAIIASWSRGQAFGRVDLSFDRVARTVRERHIHPPHRVCAHSGYTFDTCGSPDNPPVSYAGQPVEVDDSLLEKLSSATQAVQAFKEKQFGIAIRHDMPRPPTPDTPLAHLLADVLLASAENADAAIFNAVGGARAGLSQGPLTYGGIYEVMPFDNDVVTFELTAAQVEQVFTEQLDPRRRWAASIAGITLKAECVDEQVKVNAFRENGAEIPPDEMLTIVTSDFLTAGGAQILSSVLPSDDPSIRHDSLRFRTAIEHWFEHRATNSANGWLNYKNDQRLVDFKSVSETCNGSD